MIENILILESIDYLISSGKTGTRKDLARKFEVSERTISRWIDLMRLHGAQISFCRTKRSFRYDMPGRFLIKIEFVKE
jgi:predicted DNA-binding transcriptional regulator YafY